MCNKKHFRRIPDYITRELNGINSQFIVVATTLKLSETDILKGKYKKLGISIRNGNLVFDESFVPPVSNGPYSKKNCYGYDIVFKNRPKVSKTFYWETPNFGDPSRGYHENSRTQIVFQRKFIAPRDWSLSLQLVKCDGTSVILKISIATIFNRKMSTFSDDLFFAINLLQENTGDSHVFNANATLDDYLRITKLDWEIFPKGSLDRAVKKVKGQIRNMTPQKAKQIDERANFISTLKPTEYFVGIGMNNKYFGAKFRDDLVAFENVDYGNAIYILFGNWEELSKKSRTEILQRPDKDFVRIPHTSYWKSNLRSELKRHMK